MLFDLHPSSVDIIDRKTLSIFLGEINRIFGKYPNIAREAIKQIRRTKEKSFIIDAVAPIGGAGFHTNPWQWSISICWNECSSYEDYLSKIRRMAAEPGKEGFKLAEGLEVEAVIAHEMGHLITFVFANSHLFDKIELPSDPTRDRLDTGVESMKKIISRLQEVCGNNEVICNILMANGFTLDGDVLRANTDCLKTCLRMCKSDLDDRRAAEKMVRFRSAADYIRYSI